MSEFTAVSSLKNKTINSDWFCLYKAPQPLQATSASYQTCMTLAQRV